MSRILLLLTLLLTVLAPPALALAQSADAALDHESERALVRGLTHMRTAEWESAISVFMEALRVTPDEPALLVAMSEAQQSFGDAELALFYSTAAARVAPHRADVMHVHANALLASGNVDDALQVLQQLGAEHPTDVQAATRLLTLYLQLDRISDAVVMDASLEARFGAYPDLLTLRADVLEQAGETPRLISVLEQLSVFVDVDDRLAQAHARNGDIHAAARLWLDMVPDVEALENLAAVADRVTDPGLRFEIERMDLAEAGAPAAAENPLARARTLLRDGRLEKAAELIEQIVEDDPRQLELWIEGVVALKTLSEWTRAATLGLDGLVLYPNYGPLVLPTAEALAADGRSAEAIQLARAALERSRDTDAWTAPLRRLLDALESPQ